MLFTMVDPHRGYEVAYNRWYERDHFYAGCMIGPGILAGKRWVAPREYKALRYVPHDSPIANEASRGSYLALYWIERSQQDEWGAWAAKHVHRLHAENRMFAERDHVHTRMYRYRGAASRDDDAVPPELALDHPFAGVVAVIGDATSAQDAAGVTPAEVGGSSSMCLTFTPVPIPDDAPADVPRSTDERSRFVHLYFLDRDPLDVWDDEFAGVEQRVGGARVQWVGAFIPTIPGTDTYADQLW
jgi:hypothetical protein